MERVHAFSFPWRGSIVHVLPNRGPIDLSSLEDMMRRVDAVFRSAFGTTTLDERVADVQSQSFSIRRHRDLAHLRKETGDLLASVLQLCNECGWQPNELVEQTLDRIDDRSEIYQRLGRKQRIGLLRGAFDPIHLGHIEIAKSILAAHVADEVWLMPSFDPLSGKERLPAADRLEMCRLAVQGLPNIRVSDYEIEHSFRGELYHLVKRLLGDTSFRDKIEFMMIVGQDHADHLLSSSHGEPLEQLIPFVVVPRAGNESIRTSAWYNRPPHQLVPANNISAESIRSSEVRALLQHSDPAVAALLPDAVMAYIRDRKLYSVPSVRQPQMRIAIYADSFDPPTSAQRDQIQSLLDHGFSKVILHPMVASNDLGEYDFALPKHRAAIVSLAFSDLPNVEIDYEDISIGRQSSLYDIHYRNSDQGDVWLVVRKSLLSKLQGQQLRWTRTEEYPHRGWEQLKFALLDDASSETVGLEMPANHQTIRAPIGLSSEQLRSKLFQGESIRAFVPEAVADYIQRHRLFLPGTMASAVHFQIASPRLMIVYDERNANSVALAEQYRHYESDAPNLILVIGGDGTMLRAIREHWAKRLPFVGFNAGHLGFLMNAKLPLDLHNATLISQSLPLLRVDARYPNGEQILSLAYGDAWVERAEGQAAWLRVDLNGETQLEKVVGDGMLVATASGSSAYARAMGAVPVPIDSPSLTLAGSNIFQPRFWKPMNLPATSRITLTSLDTIGKRPVRAFVDGLPLGLVQEIGVRQSLTASVELAFTKEFEPSSKLLKSLFPSDRS